MKTILTAGLVLSAAWSSAALSQATSGMYEKASSQAVLKISADPKVRRFAQMMIRDHAKSTADVKAAAVQAGLVPTPPVLSPEQARMLAALNATRGVSRDRLYVTRQKAAHQKALALHSGYAAGGTDSSLRTVAARTAPVVQHHIEMLNAM